MLSLPHRVPGGNGAHEADTTSSHTNGNGNGRALPLSTTGIAGGAAHLSTWLEARATLPHQPFFKLRHVAAAAQRAKYEQWHGRHAVAPSWGMQAAPSTNLRIIMRRSSSTTLLYNDEARLTAAHPHRSYDEEKAAFMDGLLRGDNGAGGGGGGGGEEENRWLLDNAPPGAFSRERTVRLTPAVVRSHESADHASAGLTVHAL